MLKVCGILLLAGVPAIYLFTPSPTHLIFAVIYAFLAAVVLIISFNRIRWYYANPLVFLGTAQVTLIGHALALRIILSTQLPVEESLIHAGIFYVQTLILITMSPYSLATNMTIALEHVALSAFAVAPTFSSERILAWSAVLFFVNSYAVGVQLMNWMHRRRHAAAEIVAADLQDQNNRLRLDAIERDMRLAQQVQESLSTVAEIVRCRHSTVHLFQKRHEILGGDWMGTRVVGENELIIAVADVTGKGIPAAMVAQAINTLWANAMRNPSFDAVAWLQQVNETLLLMGEKTPHTATMGILVVTDADVTYHSCGHLPVFLKLKGEAKNGGFYTLGGHGNLLGYVRHLDMQPGKFDLRKQPISSILIGTDGVFDRGTRTKFQTLANLITKIDQRNEDNLWDNSIADDKLLIRVDRAA